MLPKALAPVSLDVFTQRKIKLLAFARKLLKRVSLLKDLRATSASFF
jgi:hypothetical protein